MYAIAEVSNDFNPANLSNPSSLQINSQLVAIGAGGRGEALRYIYIYIYIWYKDRYALRKAKHVSYEFTFFNRNLKNLYLFK